MGCCTSSWARLVSLGSLPPASSLPADLSLSRILAGYGTRRLPVYSSSLPSLASLRAPKVLSASSSHSQSCLALSGSRHCSPVLRQGSQKKDRYRNIQGQHCNCALPM